MWLCRLFVSGLSSQPLIIWFIREAGASEHDGVKTSSLAGQLSKLITQLAGEPERQGLEISDVGMNNGEPL